MPFLVGISTFPKRNKGTIFPEINQSSPSDSHMCMAHPQMI